MTTQVLSNHGLQFDFVDTTDIQNIEKAIKKNTRWIFVETPTNPMLEVTDIAAVSELCKKHNLFFAVDNTFMSPYGQRPIELGADCVMHSSTKFIGGHSDVLGGILVAKTKELSEKLQDKLYYNLYNPKDGIAQTETKLPDLDINLSSLYDIKTEKDLSH